MKEFETSRARIRILKGSEVTEARAEALSDLRETVMRLKSPIHRDKERRNLSEFARSCDEVYCLEETGGDVVGFFMIRATKPGGRLGG